MKFVSKRQYFGTMILFMSILFLILNFTIAMAISGWVTQFAINKEFSSYSSIQKVNDLILDTTLLQATSKQQSDFYNAMGYISLILIIATLTVIFIIKKFINLEKHWFKEVIPTNDYFKHTELAVSIIFGIFAACAISYFSSFALISALREQTIFNFMGLIVDSKQPEIQSNILVEYLKNNFLESFKASNGFHYFLSSLIFPGTGLIFYKLKGKLDFWIMTLFLTSVLVIPFWFFITMTLLI